MKKILSILFITCTLTSFSQVKDLKWHTNVNEAINISIQTEKPLFFFFTGSDWCGWCKRLQKEVFFKPEFKKWATKNVVLVELDFPRRTKIDPETLQQNRKLAQMFGVRGYPTIWLVTPELQEGKTNFNKLGKQGYMAGGPKVWIENANEIKTAINERKEELLDEELDKMFDVLNRKSPEGGPRWFDL